jgi:hypothetical protein
MSSLERRELHSRLRRLLFWMQSLPSLNWPPESTERSDQMDQLDARDCDPVASKALQSKYWARAEFDRSAILFAQIIAIAAVVFEMSDPNSQARQLTKNGLAAA